MALLWCGLHLVPFFEGHLLRELDLFCALALVFCHLGARRMMVITTGAAMTGCIVTLLTLEITPTFVTWVEGTIPRTIFPLFAAVLIFLLSSILPVLPTYMISANFVVPTLIALHFPILNAHLFCFLFAVLGDALPFSGFTQRTLDHITGKALILWPELKPLLLLFFIPFLLLI